MRVRSVIGAPVRLIRHVRGTDVPADVVRCRDDLRDRVVALTFDDGPSEWTEPILDTLRAAGANATFFVIGDAVAGNERILRRIAAEGHEIGNHTMRHPRLDSVSRRRMRWEIIEATRAIARVTGTPPTVFRPPGFGYNKPVLEVARALGFDPVVLASATTDDYSRGSAQEIVDEIVKRVRPGGIIDLHDGRPPNDPPSDLGGTRLDRRPTVEAVRLLLGALEGFAFVTVSELLARPA